MNLSIVNTGLVKKGFGRRWEFSATVAAGDCQRLRVMFPLESKPGYASDKKIRNLMSRAMKELRRVVFGGEPMPGFWSIYKVT